MESYVSWGLQNEVLLCYCLIKIQELIKFSATASSRFRSLAVLQSFSAQNLIKVSEYIFISGKMTDMKITTFQFRMLIFLSTGNFRHKGKSIFTPRSKATDRLELGKTEGRRRTESWGEEIARTGFS
jgi:hypothetical protein